MDTTSNTFSLQSCSTNMIFNPNDKLQRPRGCLYIFYEKEFRDQEKQIYKIGYTSRNARDRLLEYPFDTKIILEIYLNLPPNEILDIETEIKRKFKLKFRPCPPSTERFEGDIREMEKYFKEIILEKTKDKETSFQEDIIYFPSKITDFQNQQLYKTWDKISEFIQSLNQEQLDDMEIILQERKKSQYQYDQSLEYNFIIKKNLEQSS